MKISCSFAPGPKTPEQIAAAESLGYDGAWCNDSAALYSDVWMTLALAARATSKIRLGVAVAVPTLRHVMSTAAAIATLEQLAPQRVGVAFGTGLTGAVTLGKKPMSWASVESYVRTIRELLNGGACDWEGSSVRMLHRGGRVTESAGKVPLWIAADGPKGIDVAARVGDGVFSTGRLHPDALTVPERALLFFGTVLQPGEVPSDARVQQAAAPAVAAALHAMEFRGKDLAPLPGGSAWLQAAARLPATTRHLALHQGHLEQLNDVDKHAWPDAGELVTSFSLTGPPDEVRDRARSLEEQGVTELVYQPIGPDPIRELQAMAAALGVSARSG